MIPLEKLLTMQEAADLLSVNKKTLLAHIREGRIAYVNVGAGHVRESRRFRPSDIAAFIQGQRMICQPVSQQGKPYKRRKTAEPVVFGGIRGLLARKEAEKRGGKT